MNFTIERNTLLKPLGHIYSIVERRNTIPILSNVLIETNSSKVSFTATDMDMDIVETARCIVSTQGKVTVSAHTLYDIVRKLTDGSEISIKLTDTNLEVSAGKSKFILPTLPVDDYPIMSEIENVSKFFIQSVDLASLIDNTKFAISLEETRYYLNGIFLHVPDANKDKLRAVATDGHRLAQAEIPLPNDAENIPSTQVAQYLAIYPAQRDAKAALRWIVANSNTYNINTNYITVGGSSAGAITAITAGISSQDDFKNELSTIQDSSLESTNPQETYTVKTIIDYWGSKVALDALEEVYGSQRFSNNMPPIFIAHGTEDTVVPFNSAEQLKTIYDANGVTTAYYPLEGEIHGPWGTTVNNKKLDELSFEFIVAQQNLIVQ